MLYASEWKLRCRLPPAERYPLYAANVMTGLRGARVKALAFTQTRGVRVKAVACTRTHSMTVMTLQGELHAAFSGPRAAA
jgi:hypothetical protein